MPSTCERSVCVRDPVREVSPLPCPTMTLKKLISDGEYLIRKKKSGCEWEEEVKQPEML